MSRGRKQRTPLTAQSQATGETDVLTVRQVAQQLGCCHTTVRTYIKLGKLVASQPGKRFFIKRSDFDDFLKLSQVGKSAS